MLLLGYSIIACMQIELINLRIVNVVAIVVVIQSSFIEATFMEIALIATTCASICISTGNSTMICTHIQIVIVIASRVILRIIIAIVVDVIGVVEGISIIALIVVLNTWNSLLVANNTMVIIHRIHEIIGRIRSVPIAVVIAVVLVLL